MKKNSVLHIITKNVFTLFNLVNLILALMIISVGSYKNLLFVFVAIFNTLISIVNELRAKKIVDQMRLLSEQNPTVLRDGRSYQIRPEQVVKGDILVLSLGDQILYDSIVKEGTIEVNEAFITGEQDNITKHQGDQLISGSFVVAGTAKAVVKNIGADNFVNKLEDSAHAIKTADSKLFKLMNNIVKYISYTLIPIGALLLWARFRTETNTADAVTSTVAALINMIPEGLILLTSSVLALATVRLSKKKVLVQDLYSIETLARVDCICLDKTGTLTTGNMQVKDVIPAEGQSEDALINTLELILSHLPADNATSRALHQKFVLGAKIKPTAQNVEIIPFSSERKYSGIKIKNTEYLLGATEFLTKDKQIIKTAKSLAGNHRILSVFKNETLLGFVRLEDEIRKDAKEIIEYFYKNDIAVKIISGDDLETVQNIAATVGVKDLTGIDLSTTKNHNYASLAKNYSIFTRVKPAEKKELIAAFKKQGYTVAMTGDGVNDILAMKEADVSLAIGDGSDAARRSAKMVLLKSDFSAVPSIIDEGRQSINNLERSTTLFLAKTVYASILAVLFVILPLRYPFNPIEMSLLNFTCIGFPGLILALEKNTDRIKNRFITNIVEYSFPVGITISLAMLVLSSLAHFNVFPHYELTTTAVFIAFTIDLILIYWVSRPLNALRGGLLLTIIAIMAGTFLIPFFHHFFDFVFLTTNGLIVTVSIILGAILIFELLKLLMKRLSAKFIGKD
ncbi:HAD-IC family P-type ATPase [Candidatus Saccharibacteria bacterium]|nr:HAD-IC family P-type ATPase [Candidatus Saccharibacteria bacterium]